MTEERVQFLTAGSNENNTQCEICEKIFRKQSELEIHLKAIHEHQKDTECNICGKSFTVASYLRKHIKTIHEGQKDFK